MTTRQNLTVYDEKELVVAIKKFQKLEDGISFTQACTKLLKFALREKKLLEVPKV